MRFDLAGNLSPALTASKAVAPVSTRFKSTNAAPIRMNPVTRTIAFLLTMLGVLPSGGIVVAQTTQPAATQPGAANWQPSWFNYKKPDKMEIFESTPTRDQINFYARPRQLSTDTKSYGASNEPAAPINVGPVNIIRLAFIDAKGDLVPTLLCTPKGTPGPFPIVIAVHGLHSNKAQI